MNNAQIQNLFRLHCAFGVEKRADKGRRRMRGSWTMSSVRSHKHWVTTKANNDHATRFSLPAIFILLGPFIQILRKLTRYPKSIDQILLSHQVSSAQKSTSESISPWLDPTASTDERSAGTTRSRRHVGSFSFAFGCCTRNLLQCHIRATQGPP